MAEPLRIHLCAINSQYVHASSAPWCLLKGLSDHASAPYSAQVLEGTINEAQDVLTARFAQDSPDILGLSCYIWNIELIHALLPALRALLPKTFIVLGGPEVSYQAEAMLARHPQVDAIIAGEGELPFARLVDAIAGELPLEGLPGLCLPREGASLIAEPYVHPQMPSPPDGADYLASLRGRIAYVETSRGCPYRCAFCLSGQGTKPRYLPLEQAKAQLVMLAGAGARCIKFVDRTFNAHPQRAQQILAFLIEQHGRDIQAGSRFHFEIAGDLIDEKMLALVADSPAGLFQFEIGLQSMNEQTLDAVRRRTAMPLLIRQTLALIETGKAHVHLDLIAGLPEEGLEQFAQGFDQVYALGAHALQLGFLKLLHGSSMREEPENYPLRFEQRAPYQVLDTPWMSAEDLQQLALVAHALDKVHNSGRFIGTLRFVTQEKGLRPYELYLDIGQAIQGIAPLSLDRLTCLVYERLCALLPEEAARLRDLMALDRLSANPGGGLPDCLIQRGPWHRQARKALERLYPNSTGQPRAIALISADGEAKVAFPAGGAADTVTGLHPLRLISLAALGIDIDQAP